MKTLFFLLGIVAVTFSATAQTVSRPSKTTARTPVEEGPGVLGVYEGRFPCREIAADWKVAAGPECEKVKWRLTLFQDPKTRRPTRYLLLGSLNKDRRREGTWAVVHGVPENPHAIVFQLDADRPDVSVYLCRGDENVLFVLDQKHRFRIGDDYLSFTLNRVVN